MKKTLSLINLQTFTLSQLVYWLGTAFSDSSIKQWLAEGTECKLLSPKGGGWQKGKIRICFEFIPDEPPADTPEADSLVLGEESETELGSSTTQQQ
jgi:hypothetical protein